MTHGSGADVLTNTYEVAIWEGRYGDTSAAAEAGAGVSDPGNAINGLPFTDFSLVWSNGDATYGTTVQIWVHNQVAKPATNPTDMDAAAYGWAQLGSDTVVASASAEAVQWTGRYRWITVLAKANDVAGVSGQSGVLMMTNPE
jgi:hypothetical protein